MAKGIWVEMMELKPVVVKKTPKNGARGEGRTPFSKIVKSDDFVYIFHGKGFRNEGRQLTRFLSWSNPSETSLLRSLREHLLCVHSSDGGCASFFFPSFSDLLGAISGSALHELLGGCGERGGEIWVDWYFFKRMKAECDSLWGIFAVFGKMQIGSAVFTWCYRGVK
jgi:hypothetical protein